MFGPDRFASRLAAVDLDELYARGFRGIIVDLDNTLMGFRQTELAADHLGWVAQARARGFRLVMLSNNFTDRVTSVARALEIEAIPNALKPLPFGMRRAMRILGLPRRQIAVVGDQLFTDVLSGKLCGLYTILTEPIEAKDFPVTKLFRMLERVMLPQRRG